MNAISLQDIKVTSMHVKTNYCKIKFLYADSQYTYSHKIVNSGVDGVVICNSQGAILYNSVGQNELGCKLASVFEQLDIKQLITEFTQNNI